MKNEKNVFGVSPFEYHKIINSFFIGGLNKKEISNILKDDETSFQMTCLFCYPQSEKKTMNGMAFDFLDQDEQNTLNAPKFLSMICKNEKGIHSYVYSFKIMEVYNDNEGRKNYLPLIFGIQSYKSDMNAFKHLLEKIYDIIHNHDNHTTNRSDDEVFNYKKIQLFNIFLYCTEMIKPSPHTNICLQLDEEDKNNMLKSIQFYYSSNCEIPCNQNDSDINILFAILDLEIIIKLVISILSERQILIIASSASLLYTIFPALLKLIFPFKWIHTFLPLLPKDQFVFLDAPTPQIIGILSRYKEEPEINIIIENNESKVIVDCDSNEIFGYSEYELEPYVLTTTDDNNLSDQLLYMEKSTVFGYDMHKKAKKDFQFPKELKSVRIDCKTKQMYSEKFATENDIDITSLRRKIQMAKNPNIIHLDNFANTKQAKTIICDIKFDRSFSYNVQSIFFAFFRYKMQKHDAEIDDSLINTIKETNLFENFKHPASLENSSEAAIYKNICELNTDEERLIDNAYKVMYILPDFPILKALSECKDNKTLNDKLEKVLKDYEKLLNNYRSKSSNKFGKKLTMNMHSRNKATILDQSHFKTNFGELHLEEELTSISFKFYGENGFIEFAQEFLEILDLGNSNLSMYYQSLIYTYIINSVKKELAKNPLQENDTHDNNDKDDITIIDEVRISDIMSPRNTFRETKGNNRENSVLGLNVTIESCDEEKFLIYKEEEIEDDEKGKSKLQYYLFLIYNLEQLRNNLMLLEQCEFKDQIDDVILNFYLRAYIIDKSDFPLYHFNRFMENYLSTRDINLDYISSNYTDLYTITQMIINRHKERQEMEKRIPRSKTEGESKTTGTSIITRRLQTCNNKALCDQSEIINENDTFMNEDDLPFDRSSVINNLTQSDIIEEKVSNEKKTTSSSSSMSNKSEEYFQKIVINKDFKTVIEGGTCSENIINQIGVVMLACFPKIDPFNIQSSLVFIEEYSPKIANNGIIELVAQLRLLDLSKLTNKKIKIAFWINCFNFLLIFTIFYKQWVIDTAANWKTFFKNVYYKIGNKEMSFVDMQYVILGKPLFFKSDSKPSESFKDIILGHYEHLKFLGFFYFIPTGITIKPKVLSDNDFDNVKLIVENFHSYQSLFFKIDQKNIIIPEFCNYVWPKLINKHQDHLNEDIMKGIKDKKKVKITESSWKMDFSAMI